MSSIATEAVAAPSSIVEQAVAAPSSIVEKAVAPPSIIEQAVALAVATKIEKRFGDGVDEIEILLRKQWKRHKPKLLEAAANLTDTIGFYAFSIEFPNFWGTPDEIEAVLHKMDEFKDIKTYLSVHAFRNHEAAGIEHYNHFAVYITYTKLFNEEFEKRSHLRMKELGIPLGLD